MKKLIIGTLLALSFVISGDVFATPETHLATPSCATSPRPFCAFNQKMVCVCGSYSCQLVCIEKSYGE